MEQRGPKFNCRAGFAGVSGDKFKGISVAFDVAGVEMAPDHQGRGVGKTRE
jgi:hypothetical protein